MSQYSIIENNHSGYTFLGNNRESWRCRVKEYIVSGAAETGKTFVCLHKLDALLWKYPGSRALMVRKSYADCKESCVITYEDKVLGAWNRYTRMFDASKTPVVKFGGINVKHYDYPNGSRLVVGGMEARGKGKRGDQHGSQVLSAEYDFIYVNQAEELERDDWEKLTSRATGRAGNAPYAQVFGDCNPAYPTHWIKQREAAGSLVLFPTTHRDNPMLFDAATGQWTDQGEESIAQLKKMTGVRYLRLFKGLWVQAEGAVYEAFDPDVHLIDTFRIPPSWPRWRVHDFGFKHPHVTQWWTQNPVTKQLIMYKELYMTQRTIPWLADVILTHSRGARFSADICDHDAGKRKQLEKALSCRTVNAYKNVQAGIEAVQQRLEPDWCSTGPGLLFVKGALIMRDERLLYEHAPYQTVDEFPSYVWQDSKRREEPVKELDDGMDDVRYLVCHVDNVRRRKTRPARRTHSVAYHPNGYPATSRRRRAIRPGRRSNR